MPAAQLSLAEFVPGAVDLRVKKGEDKSEASSIGLTILEGKNDLWFANIVNLRQPPRY